MAKNTNFSANLFSAILSGDLNLIQSNAQSSSILGGLLNTVRSNSVAVTIGGGNANTGGGFYSAIGGGQQNFATANFATVGGGISNTAGAAYATVPGGARGRATNQGSFVWSGLDSVDTVSTNNNSFTVRAPGGVRFITTTNANVTVASNGVQLRPNATAWTALSDRESKTDFQPIEPREVLSQLAAMPVTSWQYKHDPSRRYIGPTSQDFMAAFHLGDYDKGINTLDADGVTFAAIKGLVEELRERDKAIEQLKSELRALRRDIRSSLPPAP